MTELSLRMDSMHCGNCVARVTRALMALQGIEIKEVKVGSALLSYDEGRISRADIERAVADAGYPAQA